ncbi:hypothetical protein [Zunongwangia sp. HGR-M22]|uniref:hypothetical protein n=1 Tax=Zunongwangia sp. HGR-M22 TaxID=3015168 RepID=UPI0022DE4A00|nr:hypothetical protein [Zunongwangia sp. HGR-M22]WBL24434.1 hypothetical protein PBT91_10975 [Zunongwangia sp. HGR-M22]
MKLIYNGGNRKLSRVVNRANEILLSSFYFLEIEKYLRENYEEEKCLIFLTALKSFDEKVAIKGFWNPIGKKYLEIKDDYIQINTAHLSKSHRTLLAQLIGEYLMILDQRKQLSQIIPLKNGKDLPANFGSIARNFM